MKYKMPSVVNVQMRCHFSTQNVKSAIALLATQTDTVRCWLLEESSVKLSWQIRTSDTGIRVPIGADGRQDIPARKRRCVGGSAMAMDLFKTLLKSAKCQE